jgi:hypothetical protein
MAYAPDAADIYRRAASYAVRILKGEKPANLPVQQPIRFEFAINLKTAKTLGLSLPPNLVALADRLIEQRAAMSVAGPRPIRLGFKSPCETKADATSLRVLDPGGPTGIK